VEGRTVGVAPRPRGLFLGVDVALVEALAGVFPTRRAVANLEKVEITEWDFLLQVGGRVRVHTNIHVVGIGCQSYGPALHGERSSDFDEVVTAGQSFSSQFTIPDALTPEVADLVERDLLPIVRDRSPNSGLLQTSDSPWTPAKDWTESGWLTPFLVAGAKLALAGEFQRPGGASIGWCLPEGADPLRWTRAAVTVLHARDPDRFPTNPSWPEDDRWTTAKVGRLLAKRQELVADREQLLKQSDAQILELDDSLAVARDEAERGLRRLLTVQGDDLASAAEQAFRDLGFGVQNMDKVNPESDRREDLRVTTLERADWVAIVEVRGRRGGGAAASDLLRIGRFAERFQADEGKTPDNRWYVISQWVGRDPASRPPAFSTSPDDLAAFEFAGGLVIDTAHLFSLVRDVKDGRLSQEEARALLTGQVGRFEYADWR
jgi:hypothetical protein